ncbi:hypothetical protein E1B28_012294 [Marasmius oreades]|uniref:Yeast cell wall synthesis Kre9/Knh1-like N-terminal domain-containing protein n=1 Tax=Marasmius oreades TaxID=181124 RepID=A0A9P7RS71_9AGAR|nr:uncharacterized protein E1B28_012294 [Marasmius oreades]KAG7088281.1 hypothetical protein E1B28_012294 [Marasmius oreades]
MICSFNPRILFGCFFWMVLASGLRILGDNLLSRDVYSPRITSPARGTVWMVGYNATITWDTSNPPQHITNAIGEIVLGHLNENDSNEHLDLGHPLAEGFDLRSGTVTVKVPEVKPGENYFVVLFGDSGNTSPPFSIEKLEDDYGTIGLNALQLPSRVIRRFSGL